MSRHMERLSHNNADAYRAAAHTVIAAAELTGEAIKANPQQAEQIYAEAVEGAARRLVAEFDFPQEDARDDVEAVIGLHLAFEAGRGAEALTVLTGTEFEETEAKGGQYDGATVLKPKSGSTVFNGVRVDSIVLD
uniref:Uncharacterized protein n=1 Tax=Streptomyces sp. NBC_00003 TaxID=2903608 RepID=A0AAU2VAM9_9ACTN